MSSGNSWTQQRTSSPGGGRDATLPIANVTHEGLAFRKVVEAHRGRYLVMDVMGHHLDHTRTKDAFRQASKLVLQRFCIPARSNGRGGSAGGAAELCDEHRIVTTLDPVPGQAFVLPTKPPFAVVAPEFTRPEPVAMALVVVCRAFWDEIGGHNATRQAELAAMVRQLCIPWRFVGDRNAHPGVLAGDAKLRHVGDELVAPQGAARSCMGAPRFRCMGQIWFREVAAAMPRGCRSVTQLLLRHLAGADAAGGVGQRYGVLLCTTEQHLTVQFGDVGAPPAQAKHLPSADGSQFNSMGLSASTSRPSISWMGRRSWQSWRHRRCTQVSQIHAGEQLHHFSQRNEVVSSDRSGLLRSATFLSVPNATLDIGYLYIWGLWIWVTLHAPSLDRPWLGGRHCGKPGAFGAALHYTWQSHSLVSHRLPCQPLRSSPFSCCRAFSFTWVRLRQTVMFSSTGCIGGSSGIPGDVQLPFLIWTSSICTINGGNSLKAVLCKGNAFGGNPAGFSRKGAWDMNGSRAPAFARHACNSFLDAMRFVRQWLWSALGHSAISLFAFGHRFKAVPPCKVGSRVRWGMGSRTRVGGGQGGLPTPLATDLSRA